MGDALKRRSIVGVTETHRELSIGLEKFKVNLLESTEWRASSSDLQGVWVNKVERMRCVGSGRLTGGSAWATEGGPEKNQGACPACRVILV